MIQSAYMEKLRPYLYVTPALIFFILFFFYPIGFMIYLSFHDWTLLNLENIDWVGLLNYQDLVDSETFHIVIKNTLIYSFFVVLIGMSLSFLLALWLNQKAKIYGVVQGAIFSPHIISLVSISMLWMWLMDPQYGFLNAVIEFLGFDGFAWLSQPETALPSLILVGVWKIIGYNTLVFIAGLQSIPKDIYEAAALDRSHSVKTLVRITIPMLSPTLFFLLIINTVHSFQVFDLVYIMTQGGPIDSTNMLIFYIYQQGMDFYNGGIASAAALVLLGIVGVVTLLHFLFLAKRVHYR